MGDHRGRRAREGMVHCRPRIVVHDCAHRRSAHSRAQVARRVAQVDVADFGALRGRVDMEQDADDAGASEPGTAISWAHRSGTSVQPSSRAARAGKVGVQVGGGGEDGADDVLRLQVIEQDRAPPPSRGSLRGCPRGVRPRSWSRRGFPGRRGCCAACRADGTDSSGARVHLRCSRRVHLPVPDGRPRGGRTALGSGRSIRREDRACSARPLAALVRFGTVSRIVDQAAGDDGTVADVAVAADVLRRGDAEADRQGQVGAARTRAM